MMQLSGIHVGCCFVTLHLDKVPDKLMSQDEDLFKILLAATKKAITRKWLQPNPPSKDDWTAFINVSKLHAEIDIYFEPAACKKKVANVELLFA